MSETKNLVCNKVAHSAVIGALVLLLAGCGDADGKTKFVASCTAKITSAVSPESKSRLVCSCMYDRVVVAKNLSDEDKMRFLAFGKGPRPSQKARVFFSKVLLACQNAG